MKIRNGFVTNSSSSSFILAFEDEDSISKLRDTEFAVDYPMHIDELIKECNSSKYRKTREEIDFIIADELGDWDWQLIEKYENVIKKENPGIGNWECYMKAQKDPRYLEEMHKKNSVIKDSISKTLDKNSVYVRVNHGDGGEGEDGVLEHKILPYLACTVKRFSHH